MADQLQVAPGALHAYGTRPQIRTGLPQQIQPHLGFHDATREDLRALANWLLARALEHDKSGLLFQLACEHLRAEKIVRPDVTRLERLASSCSICVARFSSSAHRAHELGFATTH